MRLFCSALLLVCVAPASAQPPEKDTFLQDFSRTGRFLRGRPVKPLPTPDGKAVLFLRSEARSPRMSLFEFDVATGKTRVLLSAEDVLKGAEEKLSPEEKALRERMRITAGGFTSYHLSKDGAKILLPLAGRLFLVERKTGAVAELKTGTGPLLDPRFSPDHRYVSYVRDNDVHLYDLDAGKETRLTKGGTEDVSHGLAEFVAQEEMDRFSGYWWSPNSKSIVYQISDSRKVETWYVADPFDPGGKPTPFRYPRPGKANVDVRLALASVPTGEVKMIQWDRAKYPYLATVRWEKDGPLFVTVQTRDQKELVLLRIDPATGVSTALVTETDPAWVNIYQDVPRWIAKEKSFLWLSEREGKLQLELRNESGGRTRVLAPGGHGFQSLVGIDAEGGWVYFTGSSDPTQSRVQRVRLDDSRIEVLTSKEGMHSAVLGAEARLLVVTSTLWEPKKPEEFMPRTYIVDAGARALLGELPEVAEEPPFAPTTRVLQVGRQGYFASLTLPRDSSKAMSFPVLLDVYGGPHHKHVTLTKSRWLLNQWYADQGFIVVAIDGRGTPDRGRDWERAIYQKFGSVPIDDQVEGLQALKKIFPELDLKRVAVTGWSYGGTMSALAVLKRPDVFHVAAAGAPVTDWYDYDTHYTERYLGVPPEAKAAYEEASLIPLAKDLKRPLLLIHGTADDNVYFRHTLRLADALMRHGRDFEMLPMSGFTHLVRDPTAWEQMQLRIIRFLKKDLSEKSREYPPK